MLWEDRQRCILRLRASWNFSTHGQLLRISSQNPPAQRPVGPLRGLDLWNGVEESGPEWRNSKKPLIEEYTFAYPRALGVEDNPTSCSPLSEAKHSGRRAFNHLSEQSQILQIMFPDFFLLPCCAHNACNLRATLRTLGSAIELPGRRSGFSAGFRSDSNREKLQICSPAGRRPAGGPILRLSR